ncbi:uncharacterized protein LOC110183802 [Drosophila serrata]|uniref:uncharacterized protein LOC110183802 n=1 Tax=Drosophila serrata TaxID=7274 RepID=UPI000A1D1A3E|nr:uncharacterized protein LOC110183802 [Drosophila serrata]
MSQPVAAKARVIKILGRIGACGIHTEVQVQPLDFPKMHFRRSVKGRVRIGDIIDFVDTELAGQPSCRSHSNFGEVESALKMHFQDTKGSKTEK